MKMKCDECGKTFSEVIDYDMIFEDQKGSKYAVAICAHCKSFTSVDMAVEEDN